VTSEGGELVEVEFVAQHENRRAPAVQYQDGRATGSSGALPPTACHEATGTELKAKPTASSSARAWVASAPWPLTRTICDSDALAIGRTRRTKVMGGRSSRTIGSSAPGLIASCRRHAGSRDVSAAARPSRAGAIATAVAVVRAANTYETEHDERQQQSRLDFSSMTLPAAGGRRGVRFGATGCPSPTAELLRGGS
jgi:hypothetical protein